jgi:hypothetical protein
MPSLRQSNLPNLKVHPLTQVRISDCLFSPEDVSKHGKSKSLEVYSIWTKLRALCMQKGLPYRDYVKEAGLSIALLSKAKTDSMIPTLSVLE